MIQVNTSKLLAYKSAAPFLALPAAIGGAILTILQLVHLWGDWRRTALALLAAGVALVGNTAAVPHFAKRSTVGQRETLRCVFNGSAVFCFAYLTHYALVTWLYLPFLALLPDRINDRTAPVRLTLFITIFDVSAVFQTGQVETAVVFSLLAFVSFLLLDGKLNVISQIYSELHAKHAELAGVHAELRAYHERAIAQEKLAALGLLAAGIAHEINNPMAFVSCNVECLARDLPTLHLHPKLVAEYAEEVLPATLTGIQRVNAIVSDLRRFSHDNREEMVEFDLNEEVSAALRLTQGQLKQHCEVDIHLGELPRIHGHASQIAQVVVNLLVNAAQAIPPERRGQLNISTSFRDDHVLLRITDDGCGMSEETQRNLFRPFFTTKPVGVGTGLGLSIALGIVKAHGGSIDVTSALGQGTTFLVDLPRVQRGSVDGRAPAVRAVQLDQPLLQTG